MYLVHRPASHRAFPDTHVFPGGKIEAADLDVPLWTPVPEPLRAAYGAAARELFEEVGVLLAGPGPAPSQAAELARLREELTRGEITFAGVLETIGARVDPRILVPLGEKTTPPYAPVRFRNRFFMGLLPPGQEPRILPGELDSGQWIPADRAVAEFEAGRMNLAPPVLMLLEGWGTRSTREAIEHLQEFSDETYLTRAPRIRFSPQVVMFPGKTPTIPPATCTNTYILGGSRLLVIDPATPDPGDQAKLAGLIDELLAEGRRLEALVLTHHHPDHVGAVDFLLRRFEAPVWAHPATFDRVPGIGRDRSLMGGERLDLGDGGHIRVIHTPGHAPGHLCFLQEKFGALIAGDMISTLSTIVIDPPDGDMAQYLLSLEELGDLPASLLYPAHGPPAPRPREVFARYLAHRRAREDKLVAHLSDTPARVESLVGLVYDDVSPEIHPLAMRSLLAGLIKLEREGRALQDAAGWCRGPGVSGAPPPA